MTWVPSGAPGDERRVDERRDRRLEDRLVGDPAVLRGVEGALHGVDRGRVDQDPAAQQRAGRRPRRGTRGVPSSTRLTFATDPGVRMLPARQRIDGPTVTGSTSEVSSCFGSRPETTREPRSPRRPRARRRSRHRRRSSPARRGRRSGSRRPMPAPRPRAPRRAFDGPPLAYTVSPAAPPSLPAESASSTWVVAGGPRPHRRVPDAAPGASSPRIASVSNDSVTKSATAIASTRRIVRPSCLPRPRNARPSRRPSSASPKPGSLMSGGASSPRSARKRLSDADAGGRTRRRRSRRPRTTGASDSTRAAERRPTASRRGRRAAGRTRGPRARRAPGRGCPARARGRSTAAGGRPCGRATGRGRPGRAPRSRPRRRSGRAPRGRASGARPGQVGRRDEPVVAAADDDRVVAGRGRHRQATFRPLALRTSSAARRPLAPIRPPPGWVDEPRQPQVLDRRPEAGVAGDRPVEEQLLERELALEDVALGEAHRPLDVERRQHLAADDDVPDVGRELRDPVDRPRRRTRRGCRCRPTSPARAPACTARTGRSTRSRACRAAPSAGRRGSG